MELTWQEWLERVSDPESRLEVVLRGFTRCNVDYYIAPRYLPEHLIYHIVEHDIHVTLENNSFIAEAGQLMWIPPMCQHSFKPAVPGTRVLVYHHRFYLADGCPKNPPVLLPPSNHRRERFADLHDGGDEHDPLWRMRYRSSLVTTFCEIAEACLKGTQQESQLNSEQRRQIMRAIHDDAWTDAERLAQLLDYHPAYFTRIFKRSFGQAPRTWILHQRMQHAGLLLIESTKPIHEIAEGLGYSDPFLFSRQFKQVHSISPKAWRQKHGAPKQL